MFVVFFQAEDGIRDLVRSRGLGDVYKRQLVDLDGEYSTVTVPCPFPPVAVRLNDDERLALSTLSLIHI